MAGNFMSQADDPSLAWHQMKDSQKVLPVTPLALRTPVHPNKVRFVCLSDTHCRDCRSLLPLPKGDVLLHSGDFTLLGRPQEVAEFNTFLGNLPFKYKVVIAGNHELSFDRTMKVMAAAAVERIRSLLVNCIYLEDNDVEIYGIRIYGSPWTPEFHSWAFNRPRGKPILEKWDKIPEGIDILMTHGPPIGHGDVCVSGVRAGCVELLHTIQQRVKPKYHVFGHIHEGYGVTTDGQTIFINASTCDVKYHPVNPPVIFDLPLPIGYTKD